MTSVLVRCSRQFIKLTHSLFVYEAKLEHVPHFFVDSRRDFAAGLVLHSMLQTFNNDALVSVMRAAEMLSCSRSWVYKLIEAGHLKAFRIGSRNGLQITVRSLEEYLAKQLAAKE